MRKVDLVFSSRLSSPNGDSRVVRTFKESFALLREKSIELSIISADLFFSEDVDYSVKTKKGKLKSFIKKLVPHSKILTTQFLKKGENNKKKIIDYYLGKQREADVVFFHELLACYHYLKQRKDKKIKVILVIHSNGDTFKMLHIYFPKLVKTKYYKYLLNAEKEVLEQVDRLGFVSQSSMNHFTKLHPRFNSSKLFYVYNGIGDSEEYKAPILPDNKKIKYNFCCAGSITKRKGQEIIIRAFNRLSKEEKEQFNIIFLGDGALKTKLTKYVKAKELRKQIFFKGFVNDVTSQLQKSNGFILTSYDEGLPVSIIEALRLGLPIISTNVGGIPEMVKDKFNGFLIAPNEDELLKVFKNLSNYNLENLGKNSLKIFNDKFTQDAMFLNYAKIFLEVTS